MTLFITSPKFPVTFKSPFPFSFIASIFNISPPTAVQAKPFETPTTSTLSAGSISKIGLSKYSFKSFIPIVTFAIVSSSNIFLQLF